MSSKPSRIFTVNGPGVAAREQAQYSVHTAEVAQQSAADVLLVHLGGGTAEIQVDAGDRVAVQFRDRPGEVVQILADQLGEDRAAGGVLVDAPQDVALGPGLGVHPEELGEEIVGRAVMGDHPHEREVGHVLHRRQRGEGLAGEERRWKRRHGWRENGGRNGGAALTRRIGRGESRPRRGRFAAGG